MYVGMQVSGGLCVCMYVYVYMCIVQDKILAKRNFCQVAILDKVRNI